MNATKIAGLTLPRLTIEEARAIEDLVEERGRAGRRSSDRTATSLAFWRDLLEKFRQ